MVSKAIQGIEEDGRQQACKHIKDPAALLEGSHLPKQEIAAAAVERSNLHKESEQ
ncbi:hypothetical protein SDC9_88822 [bioreactor metagenome]|uniref:Uncharacterized protein n=1 Tax=bioreactor metagenome TaxID=1076179 RepID=A0A644ZMK3_9ZZZZ